MPQSFFPKSANCMYFILGTFQEHGKFKVTANAALGRIDICYLESRFSIKLSKTRDGEIFLFVSELGMIRLLTVSESLKP